MNDSPSLLVDAAVASAEALLATTGPAGLQAAREEQGLSRAGLADEMRVTRQSIYHYESGLRRARGVIALRYVEVLGLAHSAGTGGPR